MTLRDVTKTWENLTCGVFLAALSLAAAQAQQTMIRKEFDTKTDTHVEVLALFTKPSAGGYFPVRVKIANNLKTENTIRLDFESSNEAYSSPIRTSSSYTFSAPAGKTVLRDIMVPLSPTSGTESYSSISVHLNGSLGSESNVIRSGMEPDQPSVLLSEALYTKNASALDAAAAAHYSSHGGTDFAGKFDPKQLPDDWLAFSGYDSILMTDTDWTNIPAGGRNAILSWLRLGGHLHIYTTSSAPLGLPEDASFGRISKDHIASSLQLPATSTVSSVFADTARKASLKDDFDNDWPLQQAFGEKAFRYALFIVVLILFAMLVGPFNLFVFAKSGQRHRLFITTPIISLGASLLLIALIIFQDGFGGSGQRVVLMEVRPDGDQNAAFIRQEQFSRTGVLTKSAFTLDTPALFSPLPIAESRWARFTSESDGAKGSFNLQPNGGKYEATGDWFQSRSEHGHELAAVVPTRGRIESAGAADRLVSTFDYPLKTLFYLDPAGKWHRADHIETGKPFTLTPIEQSMVHPELETLAQSLSIHNRVTFNRINERRGCFVAVTDAAPGIATHPGIRWQKTRTIITGPVAAR